MWDLLGVGVGVGWLGSFSFVAVICEWGMGGCC